MSTRTMEVRCGEVTYVVAPLTVEQAEGIFTEKKNISLAQRESVVACIENGGGPKLAMSEVLKMPWYQYKDLCNAVLTINEMEPKPGEGAAASET